MKAAGTSQQCEVSTEVTAEKLAEYRAWLRQACSAAEDALIGGEPGGMAASCMTGHYILQNGDFDLSGISPSCWPAHLGSVCAAQCLDIVLQRWRCTEPRLR